MSELTKVDRCPDCGSKKPKRRMCPIKYHHVDQRDCLKCHNVWHDSSPVPEGPAPIQAQSMSDYRRITLAGKDALPPLAVTQGEPERQYCFFCGARIYFENGAIPVWRHHGSNFAESLSPFQHYAKPRAAQPSPVVAGIPIRTDPTIPKDVILLAGATSIKAVNVGDLAPVVPVGETKREFPTNREIAEINQWLDDQGDPFGILREMRRVGNVPQLLWIYKQSLALPATEKEK